MTVLCSEQPFACLLWAPGFRVGWRESWPGQRRWLLWKQEQALGLHVGKWAGVGGNSVLQGQTSGLPSSDSG